MRALLVRLRARYKARREAAIERLARNETPEARYQADMVSAERQRYGAVRAEYSRDE